MGELHNTCASMSPLFRLALFVCCVATVLGHGRLVNPAGRSSAWRYGYNTPRNYDDDQMYCGSFGRHHITNGGKCGICGDPWDVDLPRPHEAGGKYATGTITGTYRAGQVIDIDVEITTNHYGFFEFRLCPVNDRTKTATQDCLNQNLLQQADGSGPRNHIGSTKGHIVTSWKLPAGLTCSQCVLQWRYKTANSWGCDPKTGKCGLGEGPQEHFMGCSDIAIN